MMVKFRAWDKEDESWIDIKSLGVSEGEVTILEEWDDDLPYFIEDLGETWELMQSTGLHDKNGKEIFEGDIVKGKSESFRLSCDGEIYWDKEFCRYRVNDKKRNRQYDVDWRWELKIIGNVHENSDLIKEGN